MVPLLEFRVCNFLTELYESVTIIKGESQSFAAYIHKRTILRVITEKVDTIAP